MADAQSQESTEPTTRERIERAKSLALRARSYWKGTFLVLFVVVGATLAYALQIKRTYVSECVILVKPNLKTEEQESAQERAVRLAPKLRDTLLTRSRLEPIIREFQLYPTTVEHRSINDAVEEMGKHIGFKGRDSETFVISFEDDDPDRARVITQRLAETTMADFRRANASTTQQQADFLNNELSRAENDLEEANHALASFLAAHPEFAADNATSPFGGRPQAGTFPPPQALPAPTPAPSPNADPQLATLLRQKARLEAELRAAGQVTPPAPNETITSLTRARDEAARRVAQAQADLAEKRTRLTDQHPDMVAAKAQADTAAAALRTAEAQLEAAKSAQAPPTPTGAAQTELQAKLTELNGEIANRQRELARRGPSSPTVPAPSGAAGALPSARIEPVHPVVALETEWARLLRAVGDARAVQEDLRRRSERARLKASATEASRAGQMEIIDPAYKPTQPKKGRRNTAMAGFGLAFVLAIAYAAGRVLSDDTMYDPADVEALRLIPVLGVIPRLPPPPSAPATTGAIQPQGPEGVTRAG